MTEIEINSNFKKALRLLENTTQTVFITGKAGTGKSTLLEYFRAHTQKKLVVLAPTGVAALNVAGQTIHSFARFKPGVTYGRVKKASGKQEKVCRALEMIIIDEVSMVRADLLDCLDKYLRLSRGKKNLPFGGVPMVFIGDLYQLPPVVTAGERALFAKNYQGPYFFNARVFSQIKPSFVELTKIYRQREADFIDILNAVRNRSVDETHLEALNQRLNPNFECPKDDFYITITSTNKLADAVNERELNKLPEREFSLKGTVEGQFDRKHLPTEEILKLKRGAQVMFLVNDKEKRFVNGTLGKVVRVNSQGGEEIVKVEIEGSRKIKLEPYTWEIFEYRWNEKRNRLESETIGSFTQFPLRLAWAVTIHKSQGKTFDKVAVDVGAGTFAHGQMYVALSRCTSLQGLVLKKPVLRRHILMDWRVVRFLTAFQYGLAEERLSLKEKTARLGEAIAKKQTLEIVYLKACDEKSCRHISPVVMGQMEYLGREFLGVQAHDSKSGELRTFRVDRILEIS